jgi:hypothetical protein
MNKGKLQPLNLFELRPKRLYSSEFAEKGRIVVIVPKPQKKLFNWFMPKKDEIDERIKLDLLGSFVWNNCDGIKTVKDIAERMKQEYGRYAEPIDTQVSHYIKQLHSNKLIDVA